MRTHRPLIDAFIKNGGTALFCGEPHLDWLGAHWESRPVDNTWWNRLPVEPPIPVTDRTHALYASLTDRHSGWHHHGVFTQTPSGARIIQRSKLGDVVTFELGHGKGRILATTKDPIVEHGVQQIRHLDHYCDALTRWLCGATAHGHFSIDLECYGVAVG